MKTMMKTLAAALLLMLATGGWTCGRAPGSGDGWNDTTDPNIETKGIEKCPVGVKLGGYLCTWTGVSIATWMDYLAGRWLTQPWTQSTVWVPAPDAATAAQVTKAALENADWYVFTVQCVPAPANAPPRLGAYASLAQMGAAEGEAAPRSACETCAAQAAAGKCAGAASACASDQACAGCLACLDSGGSVATCGCSGTWAANLSTCLGTACPQCAGGTGTADPPAEICEASAELTCPDAGAACLCIPLGDSCIGSGCCSGTCSATGTCE